MPDTERKLRLLRDLLAARGLDAILLKRICNFAWLTGGAASYVNTAADAGAAALLVTPGSAHVIADIIETPRLEAEEGLAGLGFEFAVDPWQGPAAALAGLAQGLRLGADIPYPGAADLTDDLLRLRLSLTAAEGERFRALGRLCADAMQAAISRVRPGMSEYEIAGLAAGETLARGALPIVNLVATDERVFRFRHPLPTAKTLEKYAMLVLCGRQKGLVCSITRLVHFGPLPEELRRKQDACAQVDATLIAYTRPGARVADVFEAACAAYADNGFPGEWRLHHQGGPAGYQPREYTARPETRHVVQEGQVYAWNPSIAGVKSEDTLLVGAGGNEILTTTAGWPMRSVTAAGKVWPRPAILEM